MHFFLRKNTIGKAAIKAAEKSPLFVIYLRQARNDTAAPDDDNKRGKRIMDALHNKIDFAVIFSVAGANPNGDPLSGNRPRTDSEGFGEVSAVCIRRKIRNRLQDMGERIFVQSGDGCDSLRARAERCVEPEKISSGRDPDRALFTRIACEKWIDVRSFGQVFAFKGDEVSADVRGPVSVGIARSVSPVDIAPMQIDESADGGRGKAGKAFAKGAKPRVEFGLYVFTGSINCRLAEKTGFTDKDAEKIKQALIKLFENDSSRARPEGSMRVRRVYWWKHSSKYPAVSSAKVHHSLKITEKAGLSHKPRSFYDYDIALEKTDGLCAPEIYGDM